MSNAGILYLLVIAIALTAFATRHIDAKLCAGAEAISDDKAYVHKEAVEDKQQTITQGIENVHRTNIQAIDALYNTANPSIVQQPQKHDLPILSKSTDCPKAPVCQLKSRKYGLSFKQCDEEEESFDDLWNDWTALARVK